MGSPKDPKLPPSTSAPFPSVDLLLSPNALEVLKRRYLAKDPLGQVVETPEEMFTRVAQTIAAVDLAHNPRLSRQEQEARYFRLMASLEFLPNSPTLMNAGTALGQLAACFVIPVGDSMREIFEAVSAMALIHQSGGGSGFSFSCLRPSGDKVRGTGGVASGPVSFMRIFDTATEVIKQGGRRRGANMGILRVDHPDILAFIRAKGEAGVLTNFNLSVAVSDAFMQAVEGGKEYPLINPRTGKETGKLSSAKVWEEIARMAWQGGDPGVLFLDAINRDNPTPALGVMEATNPCGEMPLLPYESCNLGSVNLARMIRDGEVDWEKLRNTVHLGVQFLDNVIDANLYPLSQIETITKANRKIGLGVMGFAELLIQLGIPYDSEEALRVGEEVMAFIQKEAHARSLALGRERGSFPNFAQSRWAKEGYASLRHATVTTVAPTGTIALLAGTSSGIEPLFGLAYTRRILEGTEFLEVNPYFREALAREGLARDAVLRAVACRGTLRGVEGIPDRLRRLFVTAFDIAPIWHLKMQAAFQRHTDNAVSKTVNLPEQATPEDVRDIYRQAYLLGCKGVTVFRYGSRPEQVLYLGEIPRVTVEPEGVKVDAEYTGECRICSV